LAEEERETDGPGGLAANTIHTMDCIRGMQRLPAGSVDIIVTSPPYNIGKEYRSYNDRQPRDDYLDWIGEVAAGAARVLAEDGSFFSTSAANRGPWDTSTRPAVPLLRAAEVSLGQCSPRKEDVGG
jgi:site-specific DNA-methyltransferase (adenine-specific)